MRNPEDEREKRLDRIEVALEKTIHADDLRFKKLMELQSSLMESQNSAWAATEFLAKSLDATNKSLDATNKSLDATNKSLDATNKSLDEKIKEIAELQKTNEEKLNILIDIVDRLIPRRNGNSPS